MIKWTQGFFIFMCFFYFHVLVYLIRASPDVLEWKDFMKVSSPHIETS